MVDLAEREVRRLAGISRQTLAPHRETKLPVVTKLSELLDDVCAMYRPRLQAAKIELERRYDMEGEVTIYPSELRQVFTNLITNAIDAIGQKGGLSLSIERAGEDLVVVRVRDTGCGIPQEEPPGHLPAVLQYKGRKGHRNWAVGNQRDPRQDRWNNPGRNLNCRQNGNDIQHFSSRDRVRTQSRERRRAGITAG